MNVGRVPQHLREIITHARIDKSVTTIEKHAFEDCFSLLYVCRFSQRGRQSGEHSLDVL